MMMKKYILILFILGFVLNSTFAQDDATPVYSFQSGTMVDAQTTCIPDARTLEFVIQHKFGSLENGKSDLWGIYAPGASIRLSLNYVPIKNFQVGAGVTKKSVFQYTDLNAKWTALRQNTGNMPISLTLYGNVGIDVRNESVFGTGQVVDTKGETLPTSVGFTERLSYFSEAMVSRKFGDWLALQAGASFTHYNMVAWDYNHDVVGIHAAARIKFSPQGSIILTYDKPLKISGISEQYDWDKDEWAWGTHAKENLTIGVEFFTFTHAFQIYVGTADGILPQDIMMYNQNDWTSKGLALGFTITRLWMF
jgi:hypothetical protein